MRRNWSIGLTIRYGQMNSEFFTQIYMMATKTKHRKTQYKLAGKKKTGRFFLGSGTCLQASNIGVVRPSYGGK